MNEDPDLAALAKELRELEIETFELVDHAEDAELLAPIACSCVLCSTSSCGPSCSCSA